MTVAPQELQASHHDPTEGRIQRIVRWILQWRDPEDDVTFDAPLLKGRITIDIGRKAGTGELEAWALFTKAQKAERL